MKEDRKRSAKNLLNSVSEKMKKQTKKTKKHQVKSSYYYLFWSLMCFAVVSGQIYVGSGYREMSSSINELAGYVNRIFRFVR